MNQIAVVILNYNGQKHLADFLPSVIQFSSCATIYIADNASTDNSLALLKTEFPTVNIIELTENHGFAQGYNEALALVEAEYYVLLNSDVEVTPHWIEPIIELMSNDRTIAACQPKIKAYAQKSHFEYAGAAGGFIDHLGYPFCRGRIFQEIEEDLGQYNDTKEVFWATGACMFVRADVFHQVGGFDGDFFAHMEEIDLCWRIHHAGYKVYTCGTSEVFHVGGGTLHKSNPYKTFLNFRNGLAMLYKNHPEEGFALAILTRLVLDGVAGIKFLFFDTWQDCWAVARAHFDFYAHYYSWYKKRQQLQRKKNISTVYRRNIVWQHFINDIKTYPEIPQ
ncbi:MULTISPECIES: glycosyltransferase family 2 protein [unclassified Arcicella]|uniref:glycosyltransferase family 2 protein n=1 Tax=unclassified Arcicella TaxID=2644986 RepID=UPI002864BEB4|nr:MULTISPECIES: glycosyltransferase family 2 protein [unclassified Arcicella]MDR6562708.1 GT2 family glycosyltransferase [Arcicella sp. BE51]MDR6812947.1 GT2 family glycosyltransferase [Arcicella sp. BE140]MDR6824261.1 GT2 family glycosyltransferase [Arcicella sp. BE139]